LQRRQGCRLGLDNGQRIALGPRLIIAVVAITIAVFAARAVLTVAFITGPVLAGRALFAGPVIPRPVVARPVVARPVIPGPVFTRSVIPRSVISGTIIPVAGFVAVPAVLTVAVVAAFAPVVPGLPVFAGPIITGPVVALRAVFPGLTVVTLIGFAGLIVALLVLVVGIAFGDHLLALHGVRIGLFVHIDIEARGEHVTAGDVRSRSGGLKHPQDAEIVLGVLQIVLRQHPVASRGGVSGQLAVLVVHMLGVAADLHIVRTVGIEGAVDVLTRLAAVAAAAAATIAATLAFHTLEVSHRALACIRLSLLVSVRVLGLWVCLPGGPSNPAAVRST
jgi:hypothetical protein